jgi:phage replication initiation protein
MKMNNQAVLYGIKSSKGGMERVESDYRNGLMNSQGKRLSCNVVGDWPNSRARSFYVGSKEAGKQTNVYEKGNQLFGPKDDSPWVRVELRYGNKLRPLARWLSSTSMKTIFSNW